MLFGLNLVKVKIGPRQVGCLDFCTRVYETMIWVLGLNLKLNLELNLGLNSTISNFTNA